MKRASGYVNRSRERGIRWGAVVLGWVVAVLAGVVIGFVLTGLYNLVVETPAQRGEAATAAVMLPLLTGFLAYLIGGYVAGRRAGISGGLNGVMTAIFGLVVGSRGLDTMKRVVMGSVSESVVHHAHCSALVIRGEGQHT